MEAPNPKEDYDFLMLIYLAFIMSQAICMLSFLFDKSIRCPVKRGQEIKVIIALRHTLKALISQAAILPLTAPPRHPCDQLYYGSQQSNWPTHSALNQPQPNQVLHQLNMGYYLESRSGLSSPSLHHMRTYKGQSSVSIPEMVPGRVEDLMNTGSSRCYNSIIGTQFPHSTFHFPLLSVKGCKSKQLQ
ncbi:hypothetical protein PPACK8108_LOCUS6946 [Phakopsora pachyrhizi]|uniref:Uncharacterized protein n=1 Tax=Phakopsora pachyrhizi TaxID=170000 RepID=A0AAV0AS00_PHAPC|nr:hypothetical protein PPACK8108_LOCUS6946 [Phakopsora pachyrhizi]